MSELVRYNLLDDSDDAWMPGACVMLAGGIISDATISNAAAMLKGERSPGALGGLPASQPDGYELQVNECLREALFEEAYLPDRSVQENLLYPIFFSRRIVGAEHRTKRAGWTCYELIYTNGGKGELEVGDQTYQLGPGSLALIDNRQPHLYRTANDDGWDHTFIHFAGPSTPYLFDRATRDGAVFGNVQHTSAGLALEGLVDLNHDQPSDNDLLFHSNLTMLLISLTNMEPESPTGTPDWLHDIERYIDEHCSEDLSVANLAERAGYSESRFAHQFKECTGTSPIQYRNSARMELAKKLLVQTNWPVDQVGAKSGFKTPSNFYVKFREATGVSPAVWRQEHQVVRNG